jgi:GH15 family glucan-1,4-alpha-glucosidase
MRYRPIAQYGIIGDTRSAALISLQGSIDWLCWPRFDSRSLFARILDYDHGGYFAVQPSIPFTATRQYVDRTNVLETTFATASGIARLVDLMPVMPEEEKKQRLTPFRQLLRRIEVIDGEVPLVAHFEPRPDYARVVPEIRAKSRDIIFCEQGPVVLHLRSDVDFACARGTAEARFILRRGERRYFALGFDEHSPAVFPHIGAEADGEIERTIDFWQQWSSNCAYEGPHADRVLRSALVLKLLTYAPSGAIVAAPTTSLPERAGGVRNWDYRYCWLRDAAFTVAALDDCGFETEGGAFVDWMLYATRLTHPSLQVLYDVFGEARLPESILGHLEGYERSAPVRIGNDAHGQFQLDVYGEVLGAVEEHFQRNGDGFYRDVQRLLCRLADVVVKRWKEPDSGIWEKRSVRRQHVHAKVMAWAALDCVERLAKKGFIRGVDPLRWQAAKEEIRSTVLEHGFNKQIGSFVAILDSDELDASLLSLSRVGFLKPDDPRILSTIDAIRRALGRGDLLYRYELRTEDGLPPGQGAFLPCSFWLVEALALAGREREARHIFETLVGRANDLGLFSEEIDVDSGALLGNFPQALTHIGFMNAAFCLHTTMTARSERLESAI